MKQKSKRKYNEPYLKLENTLFVATFSLRYVSQLSLQRSLLNRESEAQLKLNPRWRRSGKGCTQDWHPRIWRHSVQVCTVGTTIPLHGAGKARTQK